jgi:hypothetical protein
MTTRLKALADRAESSPMNFSRCPNRPTAIKKSERKARCSSDAAIEYGTVAMPAAEKMRTRRGERSAPPVDKRA